MVPSLDTPAPSLPCWFLLRPHSAFLSRKRPALLIKGFPGVLTSILLWTEAGIKRFLLPFLFETGRWGGPALASLCQCSWGRASGRTQPGGPLQRLAEERGCLISPAFLVSARPQVAQIPGTSLQSPLPPKHRRKSTNRGIVQSQAQPSPDTLSLLLFARTCGVVTGKGAGRRTSSPSLHRSVQRGWICDVHPGVHAVHGGQHIDRYRVQGHAPGSHSGDGVRGRLLAPHPGGGVERMVVGSRLRAPCATT